MPIPVPVYRGRSSGQRALLYQLVSFWNLDEASGTRADAHGANNLAAGNNPTGPNSVHLVATSSQYLSIADNASLSVASTSFTFTGWFYLDSDHVGTIIGKDDQVANREYSVYRHTDGNLYFSVYNVALAPTQISVTGPALSAWTFFAAWYDASTSKTSLSINNGVATTSAGTVTLWDGAAEFALGRVSGGTPYYFNGYLDNVGFWKRVLTADERTQLFTGSGTGRSYPF